MVAETSAVAADEAAGAPPPTPSRERADATTAVPTSTDARPTASPAAAIPLTGVRRHRGVGTSGLRPWYGTVATLCRSARQ